MMKFIKLEDFSADPQIKILSLNRPEVKNAFHPEMIQEISEYFESLIKHQKETKLIVLRGEGTAFCAGADLNWMKDMVNYSIEENLTDSKKLWTMFASISNCPVPIVGIAQGAVFGGALGLLACCDYVLAEEETKFCFSEVKLGLAPAVISDFITQKIPDAVVRPYMISGEVFSVKKAEQIGLVHKTYEGSLELTEALKGFMANGTEAMRETKQLLNQLQKNKNVEDRKTLCTHVIATRRMSSEAQERLKKFLTK
jgi:methylglutaconyl-CoA hydratase